jgi:transcriptional antiterminator
VLDTLKSNILISLLQADRPLPASALASRLAVSPRMILYNLPEVEDWLKAHDLLLVRRRKVGLFIEVEPERRRLLVDEVRLQNSPASAPSTLERERLIALQLLASSGAVYIQSLGDQCMVSATTIGKDLNAVAERLEKQGLTLARRPNSGLRITGSERVRRRMIVDILLEVLPSEHLLRLGRSRPAPTSDLPPMIGLYVLARPLVEELDLPASYDWVTWVEQDLQASFPDVVKTVLMLSISVQRLRLRRKVLLWQEEKRLLPAEYSDLQRTIERLARKMEEETGGQLPQAETSELALHILSAETQPAWFFALRHSPEETEWLNQLINNMMVEVGLRLDPPLAKDAELTEALLTYLPAAIYRIRYNLPLFNPQAREIEASYPQIFEAARAICAPLEAVTLVPTPLEEIAYVAMCLIAAVEGGVRRRPPKVVVVCPLGIATSRMLVSRLKSEFPVLEIVGVYSFEQVEKLIQKTADLVITTTDQLPIHPEMDVIRVNPLLYPADRVQILSWLQKFYKTNLINWG